MSIDKLKMVSNNEADYQKIWESRSSIRTRPRKFIDFNKEGYFFPQNKQPLFLHQAVLDLNSTIKQEILLHSLYKYLNDIINLEISLINSVCNKIIFNDLPVQYSDEIKLYANTIIIDEYYHVYVARDMLLQLNKHFSHLKKFNYNLSDAYNAVLIIKQKLEIKYHDIFEIIAVCIFETTLIRELVEFFNSDDVHPSIKHYVNDHMNDEVKHYGFFYNLLCYTWSNLSNDYRDNIGKFLPDFIKLYLNITSEKKFNLDLLSYIFNDQNKAEAIIGELYIGFDINPEIPIVKNVLNVIRKSGLLENLYVKESFSNLGWSV